MHELSVVMSIVDIAEKELIKNSGSNIDEIELDIGVLSGVEMSAFDFAWEQAVKRTKLEGSIRKINRIEGKATCLDCGSEQEVQNFYDSCHKCGNQILQITKGKELRVKSLIIS